MSRVQLCCQTLGETLGGRARTVYFPALAPSLLFQSGVDLEAEVYTGSYTDVQNALAERDVPPSALVVLGIKGTGMEAFLHSLSAELRLLPIAGGVVAREDLAGHGEMVPACEDLTVLALGGEPWTARTVTFHRPSGLHLKAHATSPRIIEQVEANEVRHSALDWIRTTASDMGIQKDFWDRLAFLTPEGRLLHASEAETGIQLGADLPSSGELELAVFDETWGCDRMGHPPEGSLVFGCAGLHGLLSQNRPWESLPTAYMYGEVLTLEAAPAFANLSFSMLSPSCT